MNRIFEGKAKKTLIAAAIAALIAPLAAAPGGNTASAAATTVYINGRIASGEVMVRNGLTYLTLTDLKSLGGYTFRYNKTWKTVTITGGGSNDRIVLTLGSRDARRNGQNITLQAAPLSYENKTMIPVRVAADLLDVDLKWDKNGNRVLLTKASSSNSGNSSTSPSNPSNPSTPSRPPTSPSGPSGPTAPKPPTPPSM
ncbi:copper amine oxidase N-terminal domain-containing protein [Saccharibacillus sp. O23]|uniref:copper amine oxidase N-terminal domain-containing protein n=1 Tax=Saccharibacillus sp. O23 TaxID=2009338 RepID=UPI0015C59CBD|nr:copper amine oxidase N-terminal domain-containing protein [Saccharibacillus sp. O23]